MIIGVPKEIKNHEYRVALTPSSVFECVKHKHTVLVEKNAGLGTGEDDAKYQKAGAIIVDNPQEIYQKADMIVKVKEPIDEERKMLRENQILFSYIHLAADKSLADDLMNTGAICIAGETITSNTKYMPLLAPMSAIAGRMSIQIGARLLEKQNGGKGLLIGGIAGTNRAKVVILGAGVVGNNAATIACGMNADVWVFDNNMYNLDDHQKHFGTSTHTLFSNEYNILEHIQNADLIIGGIYIAGAKATKIITKDMLNTMQKNTVLVDVAIDQGGCFESSKTTSHKNPTFVDNDILHYCVSNIPGAVPQTSSYAYNYAALPFVLELANKGYKKAFNDNPHLLNGLNIAYGKVTNKAAAKSLNLDYYDVKDIA